MEFACVNADILTEVGLTKDHALIVKGSRIDRIVPTAALPPALARVDLGGFRLVPGFIDLQVNGGNGVLFNDAPTVDSIREIAEAHWQFGTTSLLPTLISDDLEKVDQAITAVEAAIDAGVPGIIGIHIEGPFLNIRRRGIHNPEKIRQPDGLGLDRIRPLANGRTLVTLAPECVPADQIRALHERGVLICAGHTDASYEQLTTSFGLGVSGVTHLFNAMSQLGSRQPGAVGAALDTAECWCCIIVDGAHIHPATLRIALRAKGGSHRFILVSDAMPTVGKIDKTFTLNGKTITVVNGVCQDDAGTLAGSDLDMATAVKNAVDQLGVNLAEAVGMASANPALYLGYQDSVGSLTPGKRANMVALDADGMVHTTWIDGKIVWDRNRQPRHGTTRTSA